MLISVDPNFFFVIFKNMRQNIYLWFKNFNQVINSMSSTLVVHQRKYKLLTLSLNGYRLIHSLTSFPYRTGISVTLPHRNW